MDIVYGRNISETLVNWLQGVILAFGFNVSRIRKPKPMRPRINRTNLKPSTAPPIEVLKHIGGVKLFSRYVPKATENVSEVSNQNEANAGLKERVLEYGAEYRNAVYYAATPEEAIRGLRGKLASRTSQDDEVLTLQTGIQAGLDEDCIRQFCTDNDLDPTNSITRRDLRKAVLQHRALNCAQYKVGLGKVKVFLNCK